MFFSSPDGHRLATRAAEAVSALGRDKMAPEHLLLGLLDPEETTPASRALREGGAQHDKLRAALAAEAGQPLPSRADAGRDAIAPTVGAYELIGRTEGLATGLGFTSVSAEHVLLALLVHNEDSYIAYRLRQAGGSREAVWAALQRQNVRMPESELPPLRGAPLPS